MAVKLTPSGLQSYNPVGTFVRGGGGGGGGGGSGVPSAPIEPTVNIIGDKIYIDGTGYSVPIEQQAKFIQERTGGYGSSAQQAIQIAQKQAQSQALLRQQAEAKANAEQQKKIKEQIQAGKISGQLASKFGGGTISAYKEPTFKEKFTKFKTSKETGIDKVSQFFGIFGTTPTGKAIQEERKARAEAGMINIGHQEQFSGKSYSSLLPYQQKGTAEVTKITPYTNKELSTSIYTKGAPLVLSQREREEARAIEFGAEQEAKLVVKEGQKEADLLASTIQGEISAGLPYEQGVSKYELGIRDIKEKTQKAYEQKYYDIANPQLKSIEKEYSELYKKQRVTSLVVGGIKQTPLIAGTILASTLFPPALVSTVAVGGGILGLSELGRDIEGKYYTGKGTKEERMTKAGILKLGVSGLAVLGGAGGLYKTTIREYDIGTLKELEGKQAKIIGREFYKNEFGSGVRVFQVKGYKITKEGILQPIGEAQQISNVRYALTPTGEKTFSIPLAKGEVTTSYFSLEKGRRVLSKEPILAVARGNVNNKVFRVSEYGEKELLKGFQGGYGKGILIKGEELRGFKFAGVSQKGKIADIFVERETGKVVTNVEEYLKVYSFKPNLKVNLNVLSEDYGKATGIIGRKITGKGYIRLYKEQLPIFDITGETIKDNRIIFDITKESVTGNRLIDIPSSSIQMQNQIKVLESKYGGAVVSMSESITRMSTPTITRTTPLFIPQQLITKKLSRQTSMLMQPQVSKFKIEQKVLSIQMAKEGQKSNFKQIAKQSFTTTVREQQSQSYAQSSIQASRLLQRQLQKQKMQQNIFEPTSQFGISTQGKFIFRGFTFFPNLKWKGYSVEIEKPRERGRQKTAYQPSFTGIITKIRSKVPKDYEKYGYGALRVRGITD